MPFIAAAWSWHWAFGALGGMMLAKLAGRLFDYYKATAAPKTGYLIMFLVCSVSYLTAKIIMQVLVPKMKKLDV